LFGVFVVAQRLFSWLAEYRINKRKSIFIQKKQNYQGNIRMSKKKINNKSEQQIIQFS